MGMLSITAGQARVLGMDVSKEARASTAAWATCPRRTTSTAGCEWAR